MVAKGVHRRSITCARLDSSHTIVEISIPNSAQRFVRDDLARDGRRRDIPNIHALLISCCGEIWGNRAVDATLQTPWKHCRRQSAMTMPPKRPPRPRLRMADPLFKRTAFFVRSLQEFTATSIIAIIPIAAIAG
jgi:hypothetical protein